MIVSEPAESPLTLAFHSFGRKGLPLVVLHGLFGQSRNWRSFARSFEEEFRIWTLDLRNHGDSPHAAEMDYPRMAGDVLQFIKDQCLDKAGILGHSMGGKTAMQLALDHPREVDFLVVADIAPALYPHQDFHGKLIAALQKLPVDEYQSLNQFESAMEPDVPETHIRKFLLQNLKRKQGGFHWKLGLDEIAASLPKLLDAPKGKFNAYNGPTLFVGGSDSEYLHPKHHPLVRKIFPQNRIVMLKEAGHWLHVERALTFQNTVRSFLNSILREK